MPDRNVAFFVIQDASPSLTEFSGDVSAHSLRLLRQSCD